MAIKSHIDWNELFPLLPKAMRETVMLEAVTILASGEAKPRRARRSSQTENQTLPSTIRNWTQLGDGKALVIPGRHFLIVSSKPPVRFGDVKKLWEKLLEHPTDRIAVETLMKLDGKDTNKAKRNIEYLWRTSRIELTTDANGQGG